MDLFEIIRELFESDSGWFLAIGFGLAFIFGILTEKKLTRIFCISAAAAVYLLCEVILDFHLGGSIGGGLTALIFGTAALGAALGFGAAALIKQKK